MAPVPKAGTPSFSIVVPRLEKVDPAHTNEVDQAVLLGDSAGPAPRKVELERLGLAETLEGVPEDRFDEVENAQRDLPVGANPVTEIVAEFRVEHRCSLALG